VLQARADQINQTGAAERNYRRELCEIVFARKYLQQLKRINYAREKFMRSMENIKKLLKNTGFYIGALSGAQNSSDVASSNIKNADESGRTHSLCVFSALLKITMRREKLAHLGLLAQTAHNRALLSDLIVLCSSSDEAFDYCFAHNHRSRRAVWDENCRPQSVAK
jgi:hypothetical protein